MKHAGFLKGRPDLLASVIIVAGTMLSFLLSSHSTSNEYPNDLLSYIGGTYAAADGTDPYSVQDEIGSLEARGICVENLFGYVYSPMFILLMQPARLMPFSVFRSLFIYSSLVSAWAALWLLSLSLSASRRLLMAITGSGFLLLSSVLYDCLYWGQISSWMLLSISIMVFRSYRGILSGLAAALLAMLKAGYMPFVLFIKGRRSWIALSAVLILLAAASGSLFGPDIYSGWAGRLGAIGSSYDVELHHNLSFAGLLGYGTDRWLTPETDMVRAVNDHEYRVGIDVLKSRRVRSVTLSATLLLLIAAGLRILHISRRGKILSRDFLLSVTLLMWLFLLPFVWLHYGLLLLVPLWYAVREYRAMTAVLMAGTFVLWGLPLGSDLWFWSGAGGIRSIIPMGWVIWMLWSDHGRAAPE